MSSKQEIEKLKKDKQQIEDLMALVSSPQVKTWQTIVSAIKLVLYGIFYYVRIKIDERIDKIEKDVYQQNNGGTLQDIADEY